MRVLIAPANFKGSLSAAEAAEAMARGVRIAAPGASIDLCPIADGGEGTVRALVSACGGETRCAKVTGPLGQPVQAEWGLIRVPIRLSARHMGALSGLTAVIEMASAAGLRLVPLAQRDPTRTTTYGVGELIQAALDAGAGKIIMGIGDSATCDGGAGMAQALGVEFIGGAQPMTGGALRELREINASEYERRLDQTEIIIACDVSNPLFGSEGSAVVYGPQKGATPEQVKSLDEGLRRLASLVPGVDPNEPGMGAAGGIAFGLRAFCGAKLARGIDLILEAVGFAERARTADLILTGEGRLDAQSLHGKATIGVAHAAGAGAVRVIAIAGSIALDADSLRAHGIADAMALAGSDEAVAEAMGNAAALLEQATTKAIQAL